MELRTVNHQVWGGTGGCGLGAQNSSDASSQINHRRQCTASSAAPVAENGEQFCLGGKRRGHGHGGCLKWILPKTNTDEDMDAVPRAEVGEAGARAGPGGAMGLVLKMGCHLSKRGW